MKKAILFLFLSFGCFAQVKTFSPAEIQSDLDYLNKYLRKWHPTYYAYTPKAAMDVHYQNLKAAADTVLDLRQVGNLVRNAISKVGCGHIWVSGSKYAKNLDSLYFIPFEINLLQNRLFVRKYAHTDQKLSIGDEILAINGIKTDSLIKLLGELSTSDGHNFNHKSYAIEYAFFIYIYRYFGQIRQFDITKKDANGQISVLTLPAQWHSTTFDRYFRHSIDSSKIVVKGKHINLQKTDIDANTYVIDYNSVSGPHLRKSLRQIFRYLQQHDAQNLVIDLRDNGGGNVFGGFNFMKYLVKSPLQFVNLSRRPNLTIINPRFKTGFFERITPLLFMTNPLQYPNKHGWNHAFFFLRHFRHHYDNNLFVITDGMTFSMAALTATLLKNKANAVIVGEESGGSSYASRGMAQGKILLHNTGIEVGLNVYQLKYGKSPDNGRGVMPDHTIEYNFEQRQAKKDLEMEKISELIKNPNAQNGNKY